MRRYKTDIVELKKIMAERGIDTVTELAEVSGVNRNTLGKILAGEMQPSSNVMDKLVFSLDIQPEKAGKIFFKLDLRVA